jgi:hypothetical protein
MAPEERAEGGSAFLEDRRRKAQDIPVHPRAFDVRAVTTREVVNLRDIVRYVGENAARESNRSGVELIKGWNQGWAACAAWVEKELDRLVGEAGGKGDGA